MAGAACEILPAGVEGGAMNDQQAEGLLMYVTFRGLCTVTTRGWTQHNAIRFWSPPADNSANGLVASHNITCRAKDNIQTAAVVK